MMQPPGPDVTVDLLHSLDVFLAILLAYFVGDLPLQMMGGRSLKRAWIRGAVHLGALIMSLIIFCPWALTPSIYTALLVIFYILLQLFIDRVFPGRSSLTKQILHIAATIAMAAIVSRFSWPDMLGLVALFEMVRSKALSALTIYTGTVFGGGYFIRYLTKPLAEHAMHAEGANDDLPNAGMYIGWLERLLILTAVLLQAPSMIGLILTGKSIARYPEMKEGFAEYFLIGTLLSLAIALFGGMLIQICWGGIVNFK
jgi:hypothetical protein